MSTQSCEISDCGQERFARTYCNKHYLRWRRHGNPFTVKKGRRKPSLVWDRFWEKVDAEGDCWLWTASLSGGGYGHLAVDGATVYAHRTAWELLVGPIPEGLTIDHLCRNQLCVNPDHLEPVTLAENIRRRASRPKTHCPRGHPYSGNNLYLYPNGNKRCRACHRERARRERANAGEGS